MSNDRAERIRKLLAELIAFDTVSDRSNLALIESIERYLATFGIVGRRIPDKTGEKASLWVTIGPQDRPGFVLSGHTDVVPVAGQNWSRNPFELFERDGKLYGRGSTDMKGFVAVCLAMVPEMHATKLATPIHLAISYDEEIGCVGVRPMLAEISRGSIKPLGCFVGEPTAMQVTIGHKGKHGVRATFHGLAAHSSIAPSGVNAVEYAADLIGEIRRRARELATSGARDTLYDVAHTTLLTSIVHGGAALNIVPDRCVVEFECRGLGISESTEVTDAIVAWARSEIEPVMKAADPSCGIDFAEILDYPALDMRPDHALVTLAKKLSGRNSHTKVSFGTEASLFVQMADIPSIVVGPGSIAQAHKPDEYVEMSELLNCAGFIERLISHCAGGGGLG
ncbi:acetylornithine deacetylase [Bradyrhizobium sp.]|jgi:acetylornithine deacetylase|uniref:acetylornithine deacetylase n=1 Tax=Bradyrhizobium sp. TaxID=376 RepID=UPI002BF08951|nr:acetylornithine deacetylase [Bradyrhizobium sp.]HWX62200.1 acetylornithine deacetylase [Bradyrhizobium sp.]